VEEKPEVKKAKGVYYTPKYIVEYIVQNTVGKLISSRDSLVPDLHSSKDTLVLDPLTKDTLVPDSFVPNNPVPDPKAIGSSPILRRHNLPHWQAGGSVYFVTFRSSRGVLPEPALKQVMENIRFNDGEKFDLFLAIAMPDHVHMLIQPREIKPGIWHDLGEIMKGIKGVSARRINQMLGTSGQVWQNESFDHIVRDEKEFDQKMNYMLYNPVKAGIVEEPEKYKYFLRPEVRDMSVPPTGLTPKQITKLKILDPACGSGSFLVTAYQHLLDYHLDWYAKNDPEKNEKQNKIMRGPDGTTWLTIQEKKNILLNNIFGVDIDSQAVEVTKLSLLLKVLENEDQDTLNYQLKLFHKERALPNLDNNIKCGNSLIGNDFFKNQQISFLDDDQKEKINAFDWEIEFKDIFKNGGFDVVIGNPPYGYIFGKIESPYFEKKFSIFTGVKDIYTLFIEASLNRLKQNGNLSFIVPSAWLGGPDYENMRNLFLANKIKEVILLPFDIFKDAYVDTAIFVVEKDHDNSGNLVQSFVFPKKGSFLR
jgi:REP element-mobilizing transposase RayT